MCEAAIGLDSNRAQENRRWTRQKAGALRDLALQSLSQEAVRETAWLIERGEAPWIEYWGGEHIRLWTKDVYKAVWFPTELAAKTVGWEMRVHPGTGSETRVIQHGFAALKREPNAAAQVPHGVCRADDPNREATSLPDGSVGLPQAAASACNVEASERGEAVSVSDDRSGTRIPAPAAPVAEMVMVPREPTAEMIQAMEDRQIEGASYIAENSVQYALWKEVWKAALSAAEAEGRKP
jgi:hypothetical protein